MVLKCGWVEQCRNEILDLEEVAAASYDNVYIRLYDSYNHSSLCKNINSQMKFRPNLLLRTTDMESGKAFLPIEKCIHGKRSGNGDRYFLNMFYAFQILIALSWLGLGLV